MTRKFSLGLFVSMAAAVGLHVRPCWTSCLIPSLGFSQGHAVGPLACGSESTLGSTLEVTLEPAAADPSPAEDLAAREPSPPAPQVRSVRRARPGLRQMCQLDQPFSSPNAPLGE